MSFAQLVLISAVMMGQPDAQPADQLRDEVRNLARQLGHSELAVRETAEKKLMDLGVAALRHLPVPNQRMSPEMLSAHELKADDSLVSDHLMLVADMEIEE